MEVQSTQLAHQQQVLQALARLLGPISFIVPLALQVTLALARLQIQVWARA